MLALEASAGLVHADYEDQKGNCIFATSTDSYTTSVMLFHHYISILERIASCSTLQKKTKSNLKLKLSHHLSLPWRPDTKP